MVRLLGGTLAGRLPNGMAPVAILLWATTGGSGVAFGGLPSSLVQPLMGRLMDRHGPAAVHLPSALLNSTFLAALPLTGLHRGPALATAVIVGGLTPPGRTTEAYAWLILSVGTGQSTGTALAGRLAEQPLASAALPLAGAAFALAVLLAARPRLGPAAPLRGAADTPVRPSGRVETH